MSDRNVTLPDHLLSPLVFIGVLVIMSMFDILLLLMVAYGMAQRQSFVRRSVRPASKFPIKRLDLF